MVAHLCDEVAVMQQGRIVETLTTESLCNNAAQHPYTRMLVDASRAYSRDMADTA